MDLKEKIIHESLRLFSLKGFLSTSIPDILEASNASRGGLYNHFKSKEDLFLAVLDEARRLWREKCLANLDEIDSPIGKLKRLLENYRDRYLKDSKNLPGAGFFVTLSMELVNQRPHLWQEVNRGFTGLKQRIDTLLEQAEELGELREDVDTKVVGEMIFAGMLAAPVIYGAENSIISLDRLINSLIEHLKRSALNNFSWN